MTTKPQSASIALHERNTDPSTLTVYAALTKPANCSQEDFDHIVKRLAAEFEALGIGEVKPLHRQDLEPIELEPIELSPAVFSGHEPYRLPTGSNRVAVIWTKAGIQQRAAREGTPITRREAEEVVDYCLACADEWSGDEYEDEDYCESVRASFIDDATGYIISLRPKYNNA